MSSHRAFLPESSTAALGSLGVKGTQAGERQTPSAFTIVVRTRKTVPAYTLDGYKLRGVCYGYGDVPLERQEQELPALKPGESTKLKLAFWAPLPWRVQFDILRPTGFSAFARQWKA